MKKAIKKSLYGLVAWVTLAQTAITQAALDPWIDNVNTQLEWTEQPLDQAIQSIMVTAMKYLSVLAVIYGLWWGFHILTAAWDEDKVKKWKTIIVHTVIWLVVIWLVGSIIKWVISSLLWNS